MIDAPKIDTSSENERRIFIKDKYPCIADCDMCGLCKVFHGKDPENGQIGICEEKVLSGGKLKWLRKKTNIRDA